MGKLFKFLFIALILALAGGAAFLATWDIPAPATEVEKVLDDDRFPK